MVPGYLIHVSGETELFVQRWADPKRVPLGISTPDGVRLAIREHSLPHYTDDFGGAEGTPADELFLSTSAQVRCSLIFYDEAVLATIRTPMAADDGLLGSPGVPIALAGGYFRLLVDTYSLSEPSWNFPRTRLRESAEANFGTRRTVWQLVFETWPALPYTGDIYYNGAERLGAVLYDDNNE